MIEIDINKIDESGKKRRFIFDEIKRHLLGKPYTPPDIFERIRVAKEHVSMLVSEKGEKVGICEARKHISWYIKGIPLAAIARRSVNYATTLDEMFDILDTLLDN